MTRKSLPYLFVTAVSAMSFACGGSGWRIRLWSRKSPYGMKFQNA